MKNNTNMIGDTIGKAYLWKAEWVRVYESMLSITINFYNMNMTQIMETERFVKKTVCEHGNVTSPNGYGGEKAFIPDFENTIENKRWKHIRGNERKHFKETIHYCPECLKYAYHTDIFNLDYIEKCPWHGCDLADTGIEIGTRFSKKYIIDDYATFFGIKMPLIPDVYEKFEPLSYDSEINSACSFLCSNAMDGNEVNAEDILLGYEGGYDKLVYKGTMEQNLTLYKKICRELYFEELCMSQGGTDGTGAMMERSFCTAMELSKTYFTDSKMSLFSLPILEIARFIRKNFDEYVQQSKDPNAFEYPRFMDQKKDDMPDEKLSAFIEFAGFLVRKKVEYEDVIFGLRGPNILLRSDPKSIVERGGDFQCKGSNLTLHNIRNSTMNEAYQTAETYNFDKKDDMKVIPCLAEHIIIKDELEQYWKQYWTCESDIAGTSTIRMIGNQAIFRKVKYLTIYNKENGSLYIYRRTLENDE